DQLTNQLITTQQAEASFLNAKLTREVAEIAVIEYVQGTFLQEKQTAEGEIKLADSDLYRAGDRLKWSKAMLGKGYVSLAQNIADDRALQKAKFTFEQSQNKLTVLMKFTKEKETKSLEAEVEKARSDELAKKATHELEKTKEDKLKRQIEKCVLRAPGDGLVV